ncbi:MAG: hypothetical protein LAT67_06885 [Balneolales bacterium]|nr:hypothetical protein [Balneolales bacterium]
MNTAKQLPFHSGYSTFTGLQAVPLIKIDDKAAACVRLFGWEDLPDQLIKAIEDDLIGFHNEINGLYCTNDPSVVRRRNSVRYWIENYLNGITGYDTTLRMVSVTL